MAKKWNMIVDVERCNNCRACFLAVKDEHTGNTFPGYAAEQPAMGANWLDIERKERGSYPIVDAHFMPVMCNHCDDAPCMKAAKNGAVTKRADGIVIIDPEKSKGQKQIMEACPYGAISWNEEKQIPQAWIFDAHLLDQGWTRTRAEQCCPTDVFRSVKVDDEEMQRIREQEGLEVLKPELGTKPRVYYKNLHLMTKCMIGGSVAADIKGVDECAEGAEVVLKQNGRELGRTTTDTFGEFRIDRLEPDSGQYQLEVSGASGRATMVFELGRESLYLGVIRLGGRGLTLPALWSTKMILLTGVTGKIGGETAKQLITKGAKLRALVRDAAKAADLQAAGVELVVGDIADADTVRKALKGAGKAFLLLPNGEQQEANEKQFTDLCVAAGVKHLVKMSSMEAVATARTPIPRAHWAVEEYIRASGLAWTMVKPNFFMQNLLASASSIKEQGRFSLPMGDGTTGMADARDIGAVCAEVLTGNGHGGKSHEITGPEVLTFKQVAERFSEVLGRKVEYVPMPMAQFRERMTGILKPWHLNAVCELFQEIADIGLDHTTDTFRKLIGREPISLRQFIRDHVALFSA